MSTEAMAIRKPMIHPQQRFKASLLFSILVHLAICTGLRSPSREYSSGSVLLVSIMRIAPAQQQVNSPSPSEVDIHTHREPSIQRIQSQANLQPYHDTTTVAAIPLLTEEIGYQPSQLGEPRLTQDTEIPTTLPPPTPAGWIEIEYEISGKQLTPFRSVQRYLTDSSGGYQIESKSSGTAPEAPWVLESKGNVLIDGLHPDEAPVEIEKPFSINSEIYYQFMFTPPVSADNRLWDATGQRLSDRTYRIVGLEMQEVGSHGELRTIHLWLNPENPEVRHEVWLAIDYHYLPVHIRLTYNDGRVSEKLAQSFSME